MQVIQVENRKRVKKTQQELKKELAECKTDVERMIISEYKLIPTDKPTYIVEMTMEELQLVSFYLELEKRKPIMNVNIDAKLEK